MTTEKARNTATLRNKALTFPIRKIWAGYQLSECNIAIEADDLKGQQVRVSEDKIVFTDSFGYELHFSAI